MSALPKNHKLGRVYRYGGGTVGLILLVFGALSFANPLDFYSTEGREVAGLSSNGLLALISVVVGLVLLGAAVIGGNISAWTNSVFGALFILSGLVNLAVMRTDLNILAFRMSNVIFSFLVGVALLTFGMYGRVSGSLPPDNPYWRQRHGLPAEPAEDEDLVAESFLGGAIDSNRGTVPHNMAGIDQARHTGHPHAAVDGGSSAAGARPSVAPTVPEHSGRR